MKATKRIKARVVSVGSASTEQVYLVVDRLVGYAIFHAGIFELGLVAKASVV